jgi:hypothetical protein
MLNSMKKKRSQIMPTNQTRSFYPKQKIKNMGINQSIKFNRSTKYKIKNKINKFCGSQQFGDPC